MNHPASKIKGKPARATPAREPDRVIGIRHRARSDPHDISAYAIIVWSTERRVRSCLYVELSNKHPSAAVCRISDASEI
jgi:hypothetical protein